MSLQPQYDVSVLVLYRWRAVKNGSRYEVMGMTPLAADALENTFAENLHIGRVGSSPG